MTRKLRAFFATCGKEEDLGETSSIMGNSHNRPHSRVEVKHTAQYQTQEKRTRRSF